MKKRIATSCTLVLILFLIQTTYSQSAFGHLGKRFYISGALSGGPSLFGTNLDGDAPVLRFNLIGTGAMHYVLNRKNEFIINVKRSASIASLKANSILPDALFDINTSIGEYRFRTTEVGFAYRFYGKNLDAPHGFHVSFGLGLAFSKYDTPIQAVDEKPDYPYGSSEQPNIYRFDTDKRAISPFFRFGIGKQTVFWNRFIYDYGVDIGINIGALSQIMPQNIGEDYGQPNFDGTVNSQNHLDNVARSKIQQRLFFKNLINFRMGLAMLLF